MKNSFSYSRGLGTKIFIDAIEGDLTMVEDMISDGQAISYDPSRVFEADAFAINMLCENYLYAPSGLNEIITKAESDGNVTFTWLNNRPPSLLYNKPPDFTLETRFSHLADLGYSCGDNAINVNSEAFLTAISFLP